MALTYFKRFRMELDLRGRRFPKPQVPPGYVLVPWSTELLDRHAEAHAPRLLGAEPPDVMTW